MADVVELMAVNGAPNADAETLATVEGFAALRRWLATQETSYLDNRIRKYQSYSEIGNQPLPTSRWALMCTQHGLRRFVNTAT